MFALAVSALTPVIAFADSINPASYSDTFDIGESVTVRNTVTINAGQPTFTPLDVMFLFDVTTSMSGEIDRAKATANEILLGLSAASNLRSGSGWYSDPSFNGVHADLNTGNDGATSGINDMWESGVCCTVAGVFVGSGGDFPEPGNAGIKDAAESASWAAASSRFIIAFGDDSFKATPSDQDTIDALTTKDVELIGISYNSNFKSEIEELGGSVVDDSGFATGATTIDTTDIVDLILASVDTVFEDYAKVTVDDLDAGLSGVGVTVACVSADTGLDSAGSCAGEDAVGAYDRSVDRIFEFEVTYTALETGIHDFPLYALADDVVVTTKKNNIEVNAVPEPGVLALLVIGLIGIGVSRRRHV